MTTTAPYADSIPRPGDNEADRSTVPGLRAAPTGDRGADRGDIVSYQRRWLVTDILIRDVPEEVLAAIDAKAKRMGLSRTAYLRRALERERVPDGGPVTVDHLERTASLARDLDDPDVMSGAWA